MPTFGIWTSALCGSLAPETGPAPKPLFLDKNGKTKTCTPPTHILIPVTATCGSIEGNLEGKDCISLFSIAVVNATVKINLGRKRFYVAYTSQSVYHRWNSEQ